jgi:two-component system phosphate regulon sensor histidine kinase PhoR
VWVINSRIWNEIKSNLISSKIYLKEILLFNLILIIIISLFLKTSGIILLIIFIILFNFILLLFIGKKRNQELEEIKLIINQISNNHFNSAEQINLSKRLSSLQNEIRQMFEKEKNDIDYLKKLEKMRTEFLGNVSHELRTPIFTIQGYIETLLDGALNDPAVNQSFLNKANQHTINLSNLLNDLIDISMIESGEMRMSYRYFNVNEYLENIINEHQRLADEKNIKLIYHPVRENLQVFGDKNKLKQVITNLLTNSIKYTEKGSVEVKAEEEQKFCKIVIKDSGIGISPENLNRIFERFYRVDKARSRDAGGTGLGLAIVKHIIDAHNSKIEVKSDLGKGSEFSFRLKK